MWRAVGFLVLLAVAACEQPDPELIPDELLQSELGLTAKDRVHTIRLSTGVTERASPDSLTVRPGDYVQFVSGDRMVHEISFDIEDLDDHARTFLQGTAQDRSPPLVELDARFVVSFVGAPEGLYSYSLLGNRGPGAGTIVVKEPAR